MSHLLHGMICGRRLDELSAQDRERVVALYAEGGLIRNIARSEDITQKAVRQVLVERGVPLRGPCKRVADKGKPTEVLKEKVSSIAVGFIIRKLRTDANLSLSMVGKALGVKWTRIESWQRGLAIPPKPIMARLEELFGLPDGEIVRMAGRQEFGFCTIPSQRASRQVNEAGTCPSMFCCYCTDAGRIPTECEGVCQPRKGDFDKCPERVRANCPCYSPVTAERKAEYEQFMAQRRREEERFGKRVFVEQDYITDEEEVTCSSQAIGSS